jgi:regulator of sirC expression with transglutaminase-like and TPR domain
MSRSDFALRAADRSPHLDWLMVALVAAFRPIDQGRVEEQLHRFALPLQDGQPEQPLDQVSELRRVLASRCGFRVTEQPLPEALLIDAVLASRRGHAALLAVVYKEVARRAGIPTVISHGGGRWLVSHARAAALVLDPASDGRVLAPKEWPPRLRRLCPHEVAFLVLDELVEVHALRGDVQGAMSASELKLSLPVSGTLRRRIQYELLGFRATLN